MPTTTLPPTRDAQARAWLPGPAAPVKAAVACQKCGAFESLVYSAGDGYVCCLWCGWQRRLITDADRLQAALGQVTDWPHWPQVLARLAKAAPDALPPVAALLWRQSDATHWAGPSRTTPDTTYTITRYPSGHVHCDCPHFGRGCWHRKRSQELGCVETPITADLWPD